MKKIFFFSLAILIFTGLVIGCSKSSGSNGYNSTTSPGVTNGNNITIYNMSFSPASKTVAKGSVVKWTNNDSYSHTATSNDGITFNSGDIAGGASYSYTANIPGTFDYHCTIHGLAMSGTLIVSP